MSKLYIPVVKIKSLEDHPNADTLVIAKFTGVDWQSLLKIGEFQVGDKVVFVPPDSIVPDWLIKAEKIEYLRSSKGRTRVVKLRGILSEGLVLPVRHLKFRRYEMGKDVSEILGITKWQPPQPKFSQPGLPKQSKLFSKYTNLDHFKNYPDIFEEGEEVIITEKIHGTNFRFGSVKRVNLSFLQRLAIKLKLMDGYYYTCGSRNVEIVPGSDTKVWYSKNHYAHWANLYRLKVHEPSIIFYGEIYGKGIQDLTYGLESTNVRIFDIMQEGKYLDYIDMCVTCLTKNLIPVPLLYYGNYHDGVIQEYTSGQSSIAPSQLREGCVIRPVKERTHPLVGRVILKSINPDYLLRKSGTEFN